MIFLMACANCDYLPKFKCEWLFGSYLFYFIEWPLEMRIPFSLLDIDIDEAFIISFIRISMHQYFCNTFMHQGVPVSLMELRACFIETYDRLHVLFAAQNISNRRRFPTDTGSVIVTLSPRQSSTGN